MIAVTASTSKVGDTLTATVEGMAAASYEWAVSADGEDWEVVETETDETFDVTADLAGMYVKVTVTAEDGETASDVTDEAVAEPSITLTDATMTSANTILVKFNQDASVFVGKDDLEVALADGTLVLPIKSIDFVDEDGEAAVITLTTALTDGKDYKVTLDDSYVEFTAEIGEVASVVILTDSAQLGVKTPIEFALYDANGVDVTSTVKIDTTCLVSVDTSATFDNDKASKATITFDEVDQTAEVTITYNSNKTDAEDVVGTGTITCIPAEAAVGTKLYAENPAVNKKSGSAKFYKSGVATTKPVTVEEGETEPDVYFCAVDENGYAISYDSYEVESSNDDVMSATIGDASTGKYATITVTGATVGSAVINIKAIKNGATTPYTIPVSVVKEGTLASIKIAVDKSTISNAVDQDYKFGVTVTAYDNNGDEIDNSDNHLAVNIATDDPDNKEATKVVSGLGAIFPGTQLGFVTDGLSAADLTAEYHAWGATAGTRNIKAEVSEGDTVLTKRASVSVEAITESAWNDGSSTPASVTYKVEFGSKGSTIDPSTSKNYTTARLAAYLGNKFAGYVRTADGGATTTIGDTAAAVAPEAAEYKLDGSDKAMKFTAAGASQGDATFGASGNGYSFALAEDQGTAGVFPYTVSATGWEAGNEITFGGETKTLTAGDIDSGAIKADVLKTWINGDNTLKAKYSADESAGVLTLTEVGVPGGAIPNFTVANGTGTGAGTITPPTTTTTGYTASVAPAASVKKTGKSFTIYYLAGHATAAELVTTWNADATDWDSDTAGSQKASTFFTLAALTDAAGDYNTSTQTEEGSDGSDGGNAIMVTATTVLSNVKNGVNYGAKYSDDGNLFASANNISTEKKNLSYNQDANGVLLIESFNTAGADAADLLNSVAPGDGVTLDSFYVSGDNTKDACFARPGSYTVLFTGTVNGKSVDYKASLTVKNSIFVPSVTVTDRTVDTLASADINKVLETDVDMNNNESLHESIGNKLVKEVTATGAITEAEVKDTKVTVKYVPVVEDTTVFLVPINATFKTE